MGKIIITEKNNALVLFLMDGQGHPQMIRVSFWPGEEEMLGNIYIGRVEEILPGLQAAFVSVAPKEKVFLPLEECAHPLLANREYDGHIKCGDEILVQITSKALKTKLPAATARLSLPGTYCVCRLDSLKITYSGKLGTDTVKELKEAVKAREIPGRENCGFIIRTNAKALGEDKEPLFEEMAKFIAIFDQVRQKYKTRTCHTCLYRSEPELVRVIKGIPIEAYDDIVTDNVRIHQLITPFLSVPVRLYQDPMVSLTALYSLNTHLSRALEKRVWLPGGGYLVIEPTEAMTVIDVNSGKASGDKRIAGKNLYLQINLEAAREIARQLRLRNYSGMIMVDFINMDSKGDNKILMDALRGYLHEDKVETRLVDMTALGIVEITRKKISRPLSDFFH